MSDNLKCENCSAGIHAHNGPCAGLGSVAFLTSSGVVTKPGPCGCTGIGRADADTQLEVAFR